MKVFAHHFKSEETGNDYRWRTLLQFGSSWNIIGSVVMKNPGSAAPLKVVEDGNTINHLQSFDVDNTWYAFSADTTIRMIEQLFTAYYQSSLDGIVQVFNLMNVRDPNLERARIKHQQAVLPFSKTTDEDIRQLVAPVYLGWANLGQVPDFMEDAERIFHVVKEEKDGNYLHEMFEDNLFYHPYYLMGQGKNRPKSQFLLNAFCQNTTSPKY